MEITKFFNLLKKHRNLLVIIPLVTAIATFFLVKILPDSYQSHAQISTGIIDASRHLLDNETVNVQEQQVSREFSNLIAVMKLKKLIDQVSYSLMIHDLSEPVPFSKFSREMSSLGKEERARALAVFKFKFSRLEPLSGYNKEESNLDELLRSMKYDERSLMKSLVITRDEGSDFISVSFDSANPQLSAYIVNTICTQFINYYTQTVKRNESNAITFLSGLLAEKRKALSGQTSQLQQYKIANGVLNLEEQSKAIFNQIVTYDDKELQAEKDMASNQGAIDAIDRRFSPDERKYLEATLNKYNQAIIATQEQLHMLEDKYVRSGFDVQYKATIDSLQTQLADEINQSSDKYITDPRAAKDDQVKQRLVLEVSRDLAKYSVKSITNELNRLNAKFARLVPFDAKVKTYDFDIDIAGKEYLEVLNKYNETNLRSNFSIKLKQVEVATPDVAQPSKKVLLVIISAVIGLFFCVLVLFIIFYFDRGITTPAELVNRTGLPLIGYLNRLTDEKLDLKQIWQTEKEGESWAFKELLRSIRFEVEEQLGEDKILAVTSINSGEGKSLLAISLAYSFSLTENKVLLIDGNFNNPTISHSIRPLCYLEDFFKTGATEMPPVNREQLTVIANQGSNTTLFEIGHKKYLKERFNDLRSVYDIIIIDTPPLTALNKAKEWLSQADRIIAIFEADQGIAGSQEQHVAYLHTLGRRFAGWILNETSLPPKKRRKKRELDTVNELRTI